MIMKLTKKNILIALRAAKSAEEVLHIFELRSKDKRPREAIEAARAWTRGEITVGQARKAALAAHAAARSVMDVAQYAARAAGHAAATAHVATHAKGVKFYVDKIKAS